ncbi:hypothetical protein NWF24_20115 [Variovorax paradoxus]|uniref:hypothetical protein n=1 Tax=Variovorax paradoxus TaxID=34073 RepID=UPI0021ACC09D|nr:hypothetical protein [Variovorax paradoxus]UVH55137.1 hypothetical protein NWF24_20115 [Variovorax paradoxus]
MMRNCILYAMVLVANMMAAMAAHASERFENSYIAFYLADGWTCKREGTEFVCSPPGGGPKPAIIIMTAKFAGPDDSLSKYVGHINSMTKRPGVSITQAPKQRKIQNSVWVDATLLNSEIPNYYTRYMATIKGDIAILYTFAVHKSKYDQFIESSELAVNNLEVKNVSAPKK